MKKKQLIIFSVLIAIVVLAISIFYPPADESDTAGTIGKANKYRNDETGQEKIVLRNEFLQDTSALKATIVALAQYESFLEGMNADYGDFGKTLKEIDDAEMNANLDELNSLVLYMKNNLNTVVNTRELLVEYYTKDTVDMSIDVENNLIEFGTFLANLEKKSSVVDSLFVDLNGMLDESKAELLTLTQEETDKLKAVREKMLAGIFVSAYLGNNEAKLNFVLHSNIIDAMAFNRALNNKLGSIGAFAHEKLGMFNKEKLGFWGKEELGIHNMDQLNVLLNADKLGFGAGTLNREKLGGKTLAGSVLSKELAASMKNKMFGSVCNIEKLGLKVKTNKYVFSKDNLGSKELAGSSMQSKDNLGFLNIFSHSQLGAFKGMADVLKFTWGKEKLGLFYNAKLGIKI